MRQLKFKPIVCSGPGVEAQIGSCPEFGTSSFQRHASTQIRCSKCQLAYRSAYMKANPRFRESSKNWHKTERGQINIKARRKSPAARAYHRAYWLRRNYGMSVEDFDTLIIGQSGRCAVCGLPCHDPHVDHDHKTGKVRALLCSPCNQALGLMRDDPQRMESAAAYLRAHTAQEAS